MKNENPSQDSNSVRVKAQIHKIEERAKTIPLVMQSKPTQQNKPKNKK